MRNLATAAFATRLSTAAFASRGPVTPIGELQRATMVTVAGIVERITDEDAFRLVDPSGTVRISVGPRWVPARVGETVVVDGFVDDDLGPLEIYARSLTRADGSVIALDHGYA